MIRSRQKLGTFDSPPTLTIDGSSVKQVALSKSLGVYADENSSWCMHVDKMSEKIAPVIGILKKSRQFVPFGTLLCIYNAQPHFDYCSLVWGSCNQNSCD